MIVETAAVGTSLLLLYILFSKKSSIKLPGPPGWPIVGNAWQLNPTHPHLTYEVWRKKYGSVFKVNEWGQESVIVCDHEHLHEVLVARGNDYAGRPQSYRNELFSEGCNDIFASDFGAKWKTMHQVLAKGMKAQDVGFLRLEEIVSGEIDSMCKAFMDTGGRPFNPRKIVEGTITNIAIMQLTGERVDPEDTSLEMLGKMGYYMGTCLTVGGSGANLDSFPWLRFFGNQCYKDLMDLDRIRMKLVNRIKANALEAIKNGEIEEGIVHGLVRAEKAGQLTEVQVRQTMGDFIIAGTTDMLPTLMATLNILCHHPHLQKKMQEEVDALPPQHLANPDPDTAPYIWAYISEMLRYTSLAPLSVPHKTTKDVILAGVKIPKDTPVIPNMWALHHHEDYWDQPWKIIPERFLDADGKAVPPHHPNRKRHLSFSAGPRGCMGQVMAMKRLQAMHARLMRTFDILPEGDKPTVTFDPCKYGSGMTMQPLPYKIRMVPRNV